MPRPDTLADFIGGIVALALCGITAVVGMAVLP